jgi:hypothetical protein
MCFVEDEGVAAHGDNGGFVLGGGHGKFLSE